MQIRIRPVTLADRSGWDSLFAAYAASAGEEQKPEMRDCVWHWIHDHTRQTTCLVAEAEGSKLVGFAHFRSYERPLPATSGVYIDDMFVSPEARGFGIADRLIGGVAEFAKEHGRDVVRWMTAETNYRARAVYDRHAKKTKWITYELRP
ncbi:GNAT family N-acetyltransferase [Roseobacteraceae bacterium NS-SX3]